MIKLDAKAPNTKAWRAWIKLCREETRGLIRGWRRGDAIHIKDTLYKKMKAAFYINDKAPFFRKCAFCEVNLGRQHGDIEHYRPKKGVTDEEDKPIRSTTADGDLVHPGYFWLAYDWLNLLPTCVKCNQPWTDHGGKRRGKHNRFPVRNGHGFEPGTEANEDPLLLNPRIDDPSEHIEFDRTSGVLIALSDRGQVTIEILGLNDPFLVSMRLETYENGKRTLIERVTDALRDKEDTFDDLRKEFQGLHKEIQSGKREFSIAWRRAMEEVFNKMKTLHGHDR